MTSNIESKALFNSFTDSLNKIISNKIIGGRSVWSRLLNISSPGITQWIQGKTVPSSQKLKSMVNYLSDFDLDKAGLKDVYKDFIEILNKKLDSKLSSKFNNHRTIGHYVLQDDFGELQIQARSMSFLVLRQFILTMKRLMHEVYDMMEEEKSSEYIVHKLQNIQINSKSSQMNDSEQSTIKINQSKSKLESQSKSEENPSLISKIAFGQGSYHMKTYVIPELKTPYDSFFTLASVGRKLTDSYKVEKINRMGWFMFPTDRHLGYDSSIEPEVSLYKKLLECFDEPSTSYKIKYTILENLYIGIKNKQINELYPGLILSLAQSLFHNEILENSVNLSEFHNIRKKCLRIYISGFENEIFKPIDITDEFYKRTVELSCAYNEFDFLEDYSTIVKFKNNSKENRNTLFEYKNLNKFLYQNGPEFQKKENQYFEIKIKTSDIDFKFLELRHCLLHSYNKCDSVLESIYHLLSSERMKDNSYINFNYARLNFFQELIQAIRSKIDIGSFVESYENLTTVDDNTWADRNADILQRQSANI